MKNSTKLLYGLGFATVLGATTAFATVRSVDHRTADTPEASIPEATNGMWRLEATGVRIIGGYGDNFAYDGKNVRWLDGKAQIELDPSNGTGQIVIEVETTRESGPIRYSKDTNWSGTIRIVQQLNTREMEGARIVEDQMLHGDSGNEAPVMPTLYNYFATWGPSKIWVNGEEVVSMVGSHTMFSEQARGLDGTIQNGSGVLYSPMAQVKTGFVSPNQTEFHFVAHTMQPDQNNFPPHTAWIHLHFSNVRVLEKPDGVQIPRQVDR